uniref:Putative transforming growth factor beta regulator 1 n=2 Tax=Ornithodoros turicata TaxID=34597 RepID=A0A2R5L7T7_9ACAR
MKDLVLESAALCDEAAKVQQSIFVAREERRFLLKKFMLYQVQRESSTETPNRAVNTNPVGPVAPAATPPTVVPGVVHNMCVLPENSEKTPSKKKVLKRRSTKDSTEEPTTPKTSGSKPKRKKPVTDKKLVPPIPLDSSGRPVFPIVLPGCKVHSLGEIITDRVGFHSEEHIFPVGYCSSRIFASVLNANQSCIYTCTILDAGTGPRFEIVAEDVPERPFVGSSPDECYVALLRAVNRTCGAEVIVPAARGADFFALSHPTVQNLVQSCPGARKCQNYRWIRFEVSRSASHPTERLDGDPYLSYAAFRLLCLHIRSATPPTAPTDNSIAVVPLGVVQIKQEPPDLP